MTRSGHSHPHATPSASMPSRALLWVALVFAVFAVVEIILSPALDHDTPVLLADGIHNLADAAALAITHLIEKALATARSPLLRLICRNLVVIVLGLAGPLAYGAGLLTGIDGFDHHASSTVLTGQHTSLLILLGLVSLGVNHACHRATSHHGHSGLSAHLLADSVGAVAIIITALAAPFSSKPLSFIAITAFNVMAFVAVRELRPTFRSLRTNLTAFLTAADSSSQAAPETHRHSFARSTDVNDPRRQTSPLHAAVHTCQAGSSLVYARQRIAALMNELSQLERQLTTDTTP
jgi:Co/Zn/Cd efflux system component